MATPKLVRVRDDQAPVTTYVYELQASVVLAPGAAFNADHPVVTQCPWAFSGDVEDASAAPGKKRTVKRAASSTTTPS